MQPRYRKLLRLLPRWFSSQFPLWDFFECNKKFSDATDEIEVCDLSIPFVGFLRMQLKCKICNSPCSSLISQFPLWDFFECNRVQVIASVEEASKILNSQFPLWDFFECNTRVEAYATNAATLYETLNSLCGISSNATTEDRLPDYEDLAVALSIPFVGFLRMQHGRRSVFLQSPNLRTLNSLCGISSNATVIRLGGE